MNRLKLTLILGALAVFGAAFGAPAHAQTFPTKPVTLIVPWPAGGSSDLALRAFAEAAQKHLGQPIIIENRPGASRHARPGADGGDGQARRLHDRRKSRSRSSACPT